MEQGFPLETEIDEYDPDSIHFLLTTPVHSPPDTSLQSNLPESLQLSAGTSPTPKPIGTIRLYPKLGKVSRLVVDKEYRQYGFGRVLVEAVDEYVKGLSGDRLKAFGTVEEVEGKKVVKLALHSQASLQDSDHPDRSIDSDDPSLTTRYKLWSFTKSSAMLNKGRFSMKRVVSLGCQYTSILMLANAAAPHLKMAKEVALRT